MTELLKIVPLDGGDPVAATTEQKQNIKDELGIQDDIDTAVAAATGGVVSLGVFAGIVPFRSNGYFAPITVSGVTSFTASDEVTPTPLSTVYLRVISDGIHVPTFVGMSELIGSNGYDNRSGIVNLVSMFYDGTGYLYSIAQMVGAEPADLIAPTVSTRVVADDTSSRIDLLFNEAMDQTITTPASAFAVSSGHALTGNLVWDDATHAHLVTSTAFVNGEAARTLGYVQPGSNQVADLAGNPLANFSGGAIANNVLSADSTAPTVSAIAVVNSQSGRVAWTFSELMNQTIVTPASTASVSSGHTLTGNFTWVDSTHGYWTTSTDFAPLETKTQSYTQPGSNGIQDLAGNLLASFSGAAIACHVDRSETFDRTDSSTLDVPSDGGPAWEELFGTGFAIVSNKAQITLASDTYVLVALDLGTTSYTVTFRGVTTTGEIRLPVRLLDADNRFEMVFNADGTAEMVKNTSPPAFQASGGTSTWTPGTPIDVQFVVSPTTVIVRTAQAGVSSGAFVTRITFNNTELNTATKIGMALYYAGTMTVDLIEFA
jgi:hypothetical protein